MLQGEERYRAIVLRGAEADMKPAALSHSGPPPATQADRRRDGEGGS
jgi:hypothetical protein